MSSHKFSAIKDMLNLADTSMNGDGNFVRAGKPYSCGNMTAMVLEDNLKLINKIYPLKLRLKIKSEFAKYGNSITSEIYLKYQTVIDPIWNNMLANNECIFPIARTF